VGRPEIGDYAEKGHHEADPRTLEGELADDGDAILIGVRMR
jgi:hypothetical protein